MHEDLDSLLEKARTAAPAWRIELRDPIAAFGPPAIDRVAPWIADPRLSRFAVSVVRRAGELPQDKAEAVKALRAALKATTDAETREDIQGALVKLGERRLAAPRAKGSAASATPADAAPPNSRGPFIRPGTAWHAVAGTVSDPEAGLTRLTACHRWYTDASHAAQAGRVEDSVPQGEAYCDNCARVEAGTAGATADWIAQLQAVADGSSRLHLRSSGAWHLALADDGTVSAELGDVFLTGCGWWIERPRVHVSTEPTHASGHVCAVCLQALDVRP